MLSDFVAFAESRDDAEHEQRRAKWREQSRTRYWRNPEKYRAQKLAKRRQLTPEQKARHAAVSLASYHRRKARENIGA